LGILGVEQLKEHQPILALRVEEGKLKVMGAVFDLRTGIVTPLERGKVVEEKSPTHQ
jgi:carbonic anhydrase